MKNKLLSLMLMSIVGLNLVAMDNGQGPLRDGYVVFTYGHLANQLLDLSDVHSEEQLRNILLTNNLVGPGANYRFRSVNEQGEDFDVINWGDLHVPEDAFINAPHVWLEDIADDLEPEIVGEEAPDLFADEEAHPRQERLVDFASLPSDIRLPLKSIFINRALHIFNSYESAWDSADIFYNTLGNAVREACSEGRYDVALYIQDYIALRVFDTIAGDVPNDPENIDKRDIVRHVERKDSYRNASLMTDFYRD